VIGFLVYVGYYRQFKWMIMFMGFVVLDCLLSDGYNATLNGSIMYSGLWVWIVCCRTVITPH
jgi:hypothetical protein